jgi:hypothetical protein
MSQPAPIPTDETPTWDIVIQRKINRRNSLENAGIQFKHYDILIELMRERNRIGIETYGTPLQPSNGRCSVKDTLEELNDAEVYLENVAIKKRDDRYRQIGTEAGHLALRLIRLQMEEEDAIQTETL